MKKITRMGQWANWIILAGVITAASVYLFWKLYPYHIIDYKEVPYQVTASSYKQGDIGYYKIDYCKYTDIKPTLTRWFVDGLKIEAADSIVRLGNGCHNKEVPFTIPESLPPGHWHMVTQACYKMNPVREPICYTNETDWFDVTRASTGAYGDSTNNGVQPIIK